MVWAHPEISNSFSLLTKPLGIVPNAIIIIIIIIIMYYYYYYYYYYYTLCEFFTPIVNSSLHGSQKDREFPLVFYEF